MHHSGVHISITMSAKTVVLEAAVVALGVAALFGGIHLAHDRARPGRSNQLPALLAQAAAAGALLHVLCEVAGVNRWYCRVQFAETRQT